MSPDSSRRESLSLWEMRKVETIEEFYKRKSIKLPDNLNNGIGHFNVFKLDPYVGVNDKPVDKFYEVQKQAITSLKSMLS